MTLKGDAIFEEKLNCGLKNDIRNLVIFMGTVKSLKICTLMGSLSIAYKVSAKEKSYRRVICHGTEE